MSIHPIEETSQMTDPLKGFMFSLVFSNMLGDKGITGEQFELRVQSYDVPGEDVDTVEMTIAGHKRTDSGIKHRNGSWSTEVIETQNVDMMERFESWLNIMHDLSTGITGLSEEYKIDITVNILNAKLETVKTRKLKRAWPKSTKKISYKPGSKDAVNIGVDWVFDWWE